MKTIKWGIIGCGDIANKSIAPAINKDKNSTLIAVARRNREKARDFARRHGAKRFYTDIRDLLESKEIDAVSIATPPFLHRSHAILAAEAGKHVLCEKPLAMNVNECRDIIRVCRKYEVSLGVSYYRRFYPKVQRMKEFLDKGEIGEPVLIRCQYTHWTYWAERSPTVWRLDLTKGGGGVLMNSGCHRIDLMVYLAGLPQEVSAFTAREVFHYPVEEAIVMILRFDKGCQGIANFNWNTRFRTNDFEVFGTEGRILANPLNEDILTVSSRRATKNLSFPRPKILHLPVIRDFVRCLRSGGQPLIPGEEGVKASQVVEAAYLSAKKEKTVKIERGR